MDRPQGGSARTGRLRVASVVDFSSPGTGGEPRAPRVARQGLFEMFDQAGPGVIIIHRNGRGERERICNRIIGPVYAGEVAELFGSVGCPLTCMVMTPKTKKG